VTQEEHCFIRRPLLPVNVVQTKPLAHILGFLRGKRQAIGAEHGDAPGREHRSQIVDCAFGSTAAGDINAVPDVLQN